MGLLTFLVLDFEIEMSRAYYTVSIFLTYFVSSASILQSFGLAFILIVSLQYEVNLAQFYSRLKVLIFTSILKSFDLFCSLVSGPDLLFLFVFIPIWTFAALLRTNYVNLF
jgi:hypothetical protein